MGVPRGGLYRELLNSDSEIYGGSNHGKRRQASKPIPSPGTTNPSPSSSLFLRLASSLSQFETRLMSRFLELINLKHFYIFSLG